MVRPRLSGSPWLAGRHLWLASILAGLALVLAVAGWWWIRLKSAPIRIAVLPLTNLSQDPADDYFADGLTDETIRNLSTIEGLAVRSQTSSFAYTDKPRNVREAGRQLDVEYILEGSVLRSGQQLRINAQLIRVRDDVPLWSGRFDRELADVFAIQDEISQGIVNGLRLQLGRGRRRYETSAEAFDLYLLIVVDGATVETGSFNFTAATEGKNAENVVVLQDADVARRYGQEWDRLWNESEPMPEQY